MKKEDGSDMFLTCRKCECDNQIKGEAKVYECSKCGCSEDVVWIGDGFQRFPYRYSDWGGREKIRLCKWGDSIDDHLEEAKRELVSRWELPSNKPFFKIDSILREVVVAIEMIVERLNKLEAELKREDDECRCNKETK